MIHEQTPTSGRMADLARSRSVGCPCVTPRSDAHASPSWTSRRSRLIRHRVATQTALRACLRDGEATKPVVGSPLRSSPQAVEVFTPDNTRVWPTRVGRIQC